MILSGLRHLLFGTLRRQLIVSVALVHATMMTLFIWDLTRRQEALILERQTEQAISLAQTLATSSSGWIAAHDISGLQELAQSQRRYPELFFAFLADRQGRVLAHTDRSRIGLYVTDLPARVQETIMSRDPDLVDVAVPCLLAGTHVGWARVGIGQHHAGRKLVEVTRSGVLYAMAAILLGSALAWIVARRVTRRLYAVQAVMDRVKSGDGQARSQLKGADEVARMAGDLNGMLDTLEERKSEAVRSHEALLKSESQLRSVLEKVPVALAGIDKDGMIVFRNERFVERFGYTVADVRTLEEWWTRAYPDEKYRAQVMEEWDTAVRSAIEEGREVEPKEWSVTCKSGEERVVEIMGILLGDRLLAVFIDLTERKRAESRILQLNVELEQRVHERTAQLEESNKELEAFSYSVSHDLRAPLRAIDGFSALVVDRHGADLDEEGQRLLGVVRANAGRMARLIDDLLAFSRIGRTEIRGGRLNMEEMARSAFEEIVDDPERRGKIDFRVGDLPEVAGDAALVRQVWVNLLSNAVKFSSLKENPVIEIEGALEGDRAVYRVRDNGAGFDMAYAGKLFGVFQRLHGANEFEGTGVGLALVHRIVHRHGGRIWAEGAVGQGATFSFELPARRAESRGGAA